MGITKSDKFSEEENTISSLMKALGHPARIAIMQHLLKTEGCICGDLVDVLPLAQPTVSQHLKALKAVGLIQGTIEGTAICYCINEEKFKSIYLFINAFKQKLDKNSCC